MWLEAVFPVMLGLGIVVLAVSLFAESKFFIGAGLGLMLLPIAGWWIDARAAVSTDQSHDDQGSESGDVGRDA